MFVCNWRFGDAGASLHRVLSVQRFARTYAAKTSSATAVQSTVLSEKVAVSTNLGLRVILRDQAGQSGWSIHFRGAIRPLLLRTPPSTAVEAGAAFAAASGTTTANTSSITSSADAVNAELNVGEPRAFDLLHAALQRRRPLPLSASAVQKIVFEPNGTPLAAPMSAVAAAAVATYSQALTRSQPGSDSGSGSGSGSGSRLGSRSGTGSGSVAAASAAAVGPGRASFSSPVIGPAAVSIAGVPLFLMSPAFTLGSLPQTSFLLVSPPGRPRGLTSPRASLTGAQKSFRGPAASPSRSKAHGRAGLGLPIRGGIGVGAELAPNSPERSSARGSYRTRAASAAGDQVGNLKRTIRAWAVPGSGVESEYAFVSSSSNSPSSRVVSSGLSTVLSEDGDLARLSQAVRERAEQDEDELESADGECESTSTDRRKDSNGSHSMTSSVPIDVVMEEPPQDRDRSDVDGVLVPPSPSVADAAGLHSDHQPPDARDEMETVQAAGLGAVNAHSTHTIELNVAIDASAVTLVCVCFLFGLASDCV
jgi:hypothetical protein